LNAEISMSMWEQQGARLGSERKGRKGKGGENDRGEKKREVVVGGEK